MKRVFFLMLAAALCQTTIGQISEGQIIYERKVNMHKRLPPEQENMKNVLPEFNTAKVQLNFSGTESIYKQLPEEQDIRDQAEGQEGRIIMRMNNDNETYKDYSKQTMIELRELGPRKYIIEDSLRKQSWKLTEETKVIKGHSCRKATASASQNLSVEAWYAEDIQSPTGPEFYGGLPGLILELSIGDGEIVFTPLEISSKSDKSIVKAPTNGKKISRKEFQKMMEEQFGARENGGGPVIRVFRSN